MIKLSDYPALEHAKRDYSRRAGTHFALGDLNYLDLNYLNLREIDLKFSRLPFVKMVSTDLTNANLSGAILSGANMICAKLVGANLRGANLSNSNLGCADLNNADLTGANLTGANLMGANLTNAILEDVNLTRATGNMVEIRSMQCDTWPVVWLNDLTIVQIRYHAQSWLNWQNITEDELQSMDVSAPEWWARWHPVLSMIFDTCNPRVSLADQATDL